MKTRIVIKVYNIVWDMEQYTGRKPPAELKFRPDLCDLEDGLHNGDSDVDEMVRNWIEEKYPDPYCDSFDWCFC